MPDLAPGYAHARRVTAAAGRTYYLASRLLPPDRRRAVHALYAYARLVDDAVDGGLEAAVATARVDALEAGLAAALVGGPPTGVSDTDRAVLVALADSVHRYGIDPATFTAFGRSMRMDLPGAPEFRSRYRTFAELAEYTHGSAAVIGVQLVPVLGADRTLTDGAALLGDAFQLTNFLRDVAEDLDRDRIYLPLDELAAFGVDEQVLRRDRARRTASRPLRRAVAHVCAVNRDQYRRAAPAIARLPRTARPAITAAARSYGDIVRVIADADYDVMAARAVVPRRTRVAHALGAVAASIR